VAHWSGKRLWIAVAFLVVLTGPLAPPVADAALGPARSVGLEAAKPPSTPAPSEAALLACAGYTWPASGPVPSGAKFFLVRRGVVDAVPWALWFSFVDGYFAYAPFAGGGNHVSCFNGGGGGGGANSSLQVVQFPGKPVAFVLGYTSAVVTSVTATINGITERPTLQALPGSSYRYVFGEVTGLHCASTHSNPRLEGLTTDLAIYSDSKVIGASAGGPGITPGYVPCAKAS